MSVTVCVACYSLRYLEGGAYMWVFLNWALGLRSIGCRVIWLDSFLPDISAQKVGRDAAELKERLDRFGLGTDVAVIYRDGNTPPLPSGAYLDLDAAAEADLFINLGYDLDARVVRRFRRSAFVDIDPGLTQTWVALGQLELVPHDLYFTYGETVGQPGSKIPDCGIFWRYTSPPVFLPEWPVAADGPSAYTTVTDWWGDWIEINGICLDNSKRAAFLEYVELPNVTPYALELALPLSESEDVANDLDLLRRNGWSTRHVWEVTRTPEDFRSYVQSSRGEFSCMKTGYGRLKTSWIGERALGYLSSGKPAVIQCTGKSSFLPYDEGLFRFRSIDEAAAALCAIERDYEKHSRAARALAEEYFDSKRIAANVLEQALP